MLIKFGVALNLMCNLTRISEAIKVFADRYSTKFQVGPGLTLNREIHETGMKCS